MCVNMSEGMVYIGCGVWGRRGARMIKERRKDVGQKDESKGKEG